MDPVTVFSILASAVGVADIATKIGKGCRHLQQDFSGALEHIELISQYTKSVDLAVQHISSVVEKRPQTFPSSFGTHVRETTSAVHNIVQQIQDHVQSVTTEAATSKSNAKLRHARKMTQVKRWIANLDMLLQGLDRLLDAAQLYVQVPPQGRCRERAELTTRCLVHQLMRGKHFWKG